MTKTDLMSRLDRLEKALHDSGKRGSSGGPDRTPAKVFGGGPFAQHGSRDWPVEELRQLGPGYGTPWAATAMGGRRRKAMGIGPALVRVAALSGNKEALEIARSQGMPSTYGSEALEKEFGFTTMQKAAATGVRGLSGEVRKVALAESSGQSGGYVLPPQFMTEVMAIAAEEGFIEPRAKVAPMNSRTITWPTLDITTNFGTGVSPYYAGITAAWQPEAQSINETEPQFRQTEWTAWDLVLYTVSSNQLLMDNGVGLDALLTQMFGGAVTWYREYAFLQGKGSGNSMPLGILNAPATYVQNRAVASRFILQDAAAMLSHLQIRSWEDACWIVHQSVIPQLIQMASGAVANTASTTYIPGNQLVWLPPLGKDGVGPAGMKFPQAFLHGLPLYITEKLPSLGTKGDVMLVDWSQYVIGSRLDLQVDISPHYLFRTNQLAWRVVSRCDGKPWLNNVITDAAGWQVSPFVCLN